ncbi:SGNH/GDSL hydrolase family protein [Acidisoma sp. L85]|uniref:SGNH/GDSL hydrolase family protein n=1 Tax=Acidisoma sp. L85 TaxID=1641850 RepID=UPI00131B15AA|nr:SGNH/GDSL hydrolase family protein [Acidisoma sp. L85]
MPRILVFGDSNSWGFEPGTGRRYPKGTRWPTVMHESLGNDWELVEEALNGRTTVFDDPIEPYRSGVAYWPACLLSHAPLDVIIIALGINDLKRRFSLSAADIAGGAARLVQIAQQLAVDEEGRHPQIILVSPPRLAKLSDLADTFAGGAETSHQLRAQFAKTAEALGVHFIALGDSVALSDIDGIHLDADGHKIWGRKMAELVKTLPRS